MLNLLLKNSKNVQGFWVDKKFKKCINYFAIWTSNILVYSISKIVIYNTQWNNFLINFSYETRDSNLFGNHDRKNYILLVFLQNRVLLRMKNDITNKCK